jgi:TolB-like protein/Flp pilus assembly protein TadD
VQLYSELQRRNVVRVAIGYIVSSWILIQVADLVLENIGSPKWVIQSIMLVLALGFPVVAFFSWAYEVTPEGIKRESEVDRSQSITHVTRRKLDRSIMAVLVIALVYFAFDKYVLTDGPDTAIAEPVAEEAEAPTPTNSAVADDATADMGKSIAVLPFVNMSADKSSEYFSDGLADTVLHMLAQIRELRVAARTSSFQFRDQTMDIAAIGSQLNVGAVLEGSVQRAGDKIRVTAQLIDVSNGYHLWSGNFDRNLDDVFAIQDEIASEVVSALKLSLLGNSGDRVGTDDTDNIDAYTEFLLAVNDLSSPNTETLPSAARHLQEAVRLDPNYARAHSALGRVYLELEGYGLMGTTEAISAARNAASRALDVAPTSSEALAVLGWADLQDGKLQPAGELLAEAIKNGPSDVIALQYFAGFLTADARPAEAAETYRRVIRLDPLSENPYIGLAGLLRSEKKFSEAHELVAKRLEMAADSPSLRASQSDNELAQGNLAAATRIMIEAHNLDPDDADMPALVGRYYLALDMPTEARRWFDRAVEIDPQHPLSLSAPLFLNYYLQQNDNENFQLARQLLEDGIDERQSSRFMALLVLVEYAAKADRNDIALEVLDNLYPNLFDDPPTDLTRNTAATFFAGMALLQSGDEERGTHLLRFYVDYQSRYEDVYRVNRSSLAGRLLLGDIDNAKEKLPAFVENRYYWEMNRMLLEHSSLFDPLREEPAFVQMIDDYQREAGEQRTLLQAMALD